MSLTATLIFLLCLSGGSVLIALGLRQRRLARQAVTVDAPPVADMAADVLTRRMETMLGEHERRIVEAVTGLREHLGELKSDVEWLAGERMIEQAIALARDGADPDSIGQELGLSRDTAATIALFRKH